MNNNPFKPDQPNIPGVIAEGRSTAIGRSFIADASSVELAPTFEIFIDANAALVGDPFCLERGGDLRICCMVDAWHIGEGKSGGSESATVVAAPADSAPAKAAEKLPVVARRDCDDGRTGETVGGKEIYLPRSSDFAGSTGDCGTLAGRSVLGIFADGPFGTCEMEFVTDMEKLRRSTVFAERTRWWRTLVTMRCLT